MNSATLDTRSKSCTTQNPACKKRIIFQKFQKSGKK
jgi:hypothetical protein